MSTFAIILVSLSCLTHATWNLLAKRSSGTPAFFLVANAFALALVFPFFLATLGDEVAAIPLRVWTSVIAAGALQAVYSFSLALAYRSGDMSVVYPLARTAPLFVVGAEGLLLGRWPELLPGAGITLAVLGCFILPWTRWTIGHGGLAWSSYLNRGSAWAIVTAAASAGYTVVDDSAMGVLSPLLGQPRGAIFYGYLEWVFNAVFLWPAVVLLEQPGAIKRVFREERRSAMLVGVLTFCTYLLVLWAYTHATHVAYVAGLRQLSILFGVLAGVLILRERGGRARVPAATLIMAGLLLIILG